MSNKVRYVTGFMFSEEKTRVALIRKNKPEWQKGKLNGIGGKIEDGESPIAAMAREFKEETGMATTESAWSYFLFMHGPEFSVNFFVSLGNLDTLSSTEDEKIEIHDLVSLHPMRVDMIENLPWIIPLALDFLNDGRPVFVEALYPK